MLRGARPPQPALDVQPTRVLVHSVGCPFSLRFRARAFLSSCEAGLSRLSWNGTERSSVKITERTHEQRAKHFSPEEGHDPQTPAVGQDSSLVISLRNGALLPACQQGTSRFCACPICGWLHGLMPLQEIDRMGVTRSTAAI